MKKLPQELNEILISLLEFYKPDLKEIKLKDIFIYLDNDQLHIDLDIIDIFSYKFIYITNLNLLTFNIGDYLEEYNPRYADILIFNSLINLLNN